MFVLSKIYKCFIIVLLKKLKLFNYMIYWYICIDLVNDFIGYEYIEVSVM